MDERIKSLEKIPNAAAHFAVIIGAMWAASFLCCMYGLRTPLLAHVGNLIGIASIFFTYNMLSNYRRMVRNIGFRLLLRLALLTLLFAGLITDVVQYAYFQYLDNGRMLTAIFSMMDMPDYEQALQQMLPDMKVAEMKALLEQVTVRDIVMELMLFNLLLAIPIALLTALLARMSKVKNGDKK